MTIQYVSDLHLEFPENKRFLENNPLLPTGDILILAGDIIPFYLMDAHQDFFDFLSKNFKFTYWVPGNHEYYHFDINKRIGQFKEPIRDNVFLVNNTWVRHDNYRIVFSTLWSDIPPRNAWIIENSMNDFHLIKDDEKKFSSMKYNELHQESVAFLKSTIHSEYQEKLVIVTHHVPTLQNYPSEYKNSVLNDGFVTDLDDLIIGSKIDYWIYGHHHRNITDFSVGNTKLLTNQLGYCERGENKSFSTNKIIK